MVHKRAPNSLHARSETAYVKPLVQSKPSSDSEHTSSSPRPDPASQPRASCQNHRRCYWYNGSAAHNADCLSRNLHSHSPPAETKHCAPARRVDAPDVSRVVAAATVGTGPCHQFCSVAETSPSHRTCLLSATMGYGACAFEADIRLSTAAR